MTEKLSLIPGKKICQNCRVACQTDGEQVKTNPDDDNNEFIDDSYLRDTLSISINIWYVCH